MVTAKQAIRLSLDVKNQNQDMEIAIKELDEAKKLILELDWQVTKAKHIISKYKDLVVKMQLQLNATDFKLSQAKQEKDKY